jgi:hypothetical protein
MTAEQYFAMCEQMGWEPREDEIPKDLSTLPYESQLALILFNMLPDRIEGMSGSWLGKEFSCLEVFMNIYEVENRREILDLIMTIHRTYDEHYRQQQKMKESVSKGKAKGRR